MLVALVFPEQHVQPPRNYPQQKPPPPRECPKQPRPRPPQRRPRPLFPPLTPRVSLDVYDWSMQFVQGGARFLQSRYIVWRACSLSYGTSTPSSLGCLVVVTSTTKISTMVLILRYLRVAFVLLGLYINALQCVLLCKRQQLHK